MAPEVTITTLFPAFLRSATSAQIFATDCCDISPCLFVIEEVPTFTTTVLLILFIFKF